MNKIVTNEHIDSALDSLNEEQVKKISLEFMQEQRILTEYYYAYFQEFKILGPLADEVFSIMLVVWLAFKKTGDIIPMITEKNIDKVSREMEADNLNLSKALGVDIEDEDADISTINELNQKIENGEFDNPEALVKYITDNKLEAFFKEAISNTERQINLFDYVSNEVSSLKNFVVSDKNISTEFLFFTIKCFDKVAKTSHLKIIKSKNKKK